MNRDMNAFGQTPTTRLGRLLHDLARHDVPDDRDLRDQVKLAIQQRSADRARSDGTERAWNLPALDPARQRQRRSIPDTSEEHDVTGIPTTQPDELIGIQQRRRIREALKIVAAAIVFAIIGAILALALSGGDPDVRVSVPGAGPESTAAPLVSTEPPVSPTSDRTATVQAAQTALAELTVVVEAATTATAASLPSPGEIVATIEVGDTPGYVAATDSAIWVGNLSSGTVTRIDPVTNTVVATVEIGIPGDSGPYGSPSEIVTYNDQIWVLNNREGTIARIDPATNLVAQSMTVFDDYGSDAQTAMTVDAAGVWASDFRNDQLLRIDPSIGAVVATIALDDPNGVASGFGSIWVMAGPDHGPYTIVRVDPTTNEIVGSIPIDVTEGISVMTYANAVWASDWGSDRVIRIDPATNTVVETLHSNFGTSHSIAPTQGGVWISSIFKDGVVRIDSATNQPSRVIDAEHGNSIGMVEAFGSIWVTHGGDDLVVRIDPAP